PSLTSFNNDILYIFPGEHFLFVHIIRYLFTVYQDLGIIQQHHPIVDHDSCKGNNAHHGHHNNKGLTCKHQSSKYTDKTKENSNHDNSGLGNSTELEN